MTEHVPAKYCGAEWQWHISRAGIGDAVRIAGIIKQDLQAGKKHLVLCDAEFGTGVRVNQNLTFVDAVVALPRSLVLHQLNDVVRNSRAHLTRDEAAKQTKYLIRYWGMNYVATEAPLRIANTDLRYQELPAQLPQKYIVLQFSTNDIKRHSLPRSTLAVLRDGGIPVVVIGSRKDAKLFNLPSWLIDLRGKSSIEMVMWVVACSCGVLAAETWSPLLGTMLGIPSLIGCRTPYLNHHVVTIRRDWPDLWYINTQRHAADWLFQVPKLVAAARTFTPVT